MALPGIVRPESYFGWLRVLGEPLAVNQRVQADPAARRAADVGKAPLRMPDE